MTSQEARAIVVNATSRVCMRLEYDESGQPLFADSARSKPLSPAARFARWTLSAAAGLLAACHGSVCEVAPSGQEPNTNALAGNAPQGQEQCGPGTKLIMGKVANPRIELGDVALPPAQAATPVERLGEMEAVPTPPPADEPK